MKRLRLTWVTFDGIDTEFTGVGTTTTYLLDAWPTVREAMSKHGVSIRLRLVGIASQRSATLTAPRLERSQPGVEVELLSLPGLPLPLSPYGAPEHWPDLAAELVRRLLRTASCDVDDLVVLNDVQFLGAAPALGRSSGIRVVPILHSIADNWRAEGADAATSSVTRYGYEGSSLHAIAEAGIEVRAVSTALSRQTAAAYNVPAPRPVCLGISATYVEKLARQRDELLASSGMASSFSSGHPFAVWFGRATQDKGMDIAAAVLDAIAEDYGATPVIFARDFGLESERRWSSEFLTLSGAHLQVHAEYPFELPRALLSHPDLVALVLTPRVEPFGLIPSEFFIAATTGEGSPAILYTPTDGLGEQAPLLRWGTQIALEPTVATRISALSVLAEPAAERTARLRCAADLTRSRYDIARNVVDLIRG